MAKDVYSVTNRPIMTKKTVLNNDLLEVLHAFLVIEVSVEKTLIDGRTFIPAEVIDEEAEAAATETAFNTQYLNAVQSYKKLFKSWQAGSPVDTTKVREIVLPLLNKAFENPADIFQLHHYSTKEEYFFHHAVSVALLSGFIAKKLNYGTGDILQVAMGGCLCDCGMSKVSPKILEKKTVLTFSEFEEIKKHPIHGLKMLQNSSFLKEGVKFAVFQHHERLDGSGYPSGRKGQQPHPFANIVAIADVYHALTSERIYRKKHSPFKVLEMILHDDFGKFDIAALKALMSGIASFSIGSRVRLSNGFTAEILFIETNSPTRPLVKVMETNEILHLEKKRELYIDEIIA
ncbi:HD-GYP domain-containing protein [Peribacillus saganii]|nr:HD-GYP domain-containing protein [Peribacillus saganii]